MDQDEWTGEQGFADNPGFADNLHFMPAHVFGRWERGVFVPDAERGEEIVERDVIVGLCVRGFSPEGTVTKSPAAEQDEAWVLLTIDDAEFYLTPSIAARLGAAMQRHAALGSGV